MAPRYHVALKPPVEEDVLTRLQARVEGDRVQFDLEAEGREVPLTGLMLITMLPDGLEFVAGSGRRNGEPVDDPAGAGGTAVTFRLGDTEGAWSEHLTFTARVADALTLDTHEVRSITMFGTPTERRVRSGLATVEFEARASGFPGFLDTHKGFLDTHKDLDTDKGPKGMETREGLDTQVRSNAEKKMGVQAPEADVQGHTTDSQVGVQEAAGNRVGVQASQASAGAGARRSVVLTRADSGPVRTRAKGEVPGLGEDTGYQR